jgi:hypothetical protein
MIDVPLDKNSISIESKGLENKIDSIFSDKDSVFEINKE